MIHKSPFALIILDGFGYRRDSEYNAIAQAKAPFFKYIHNRYPHSLLNASGAAVGLEKNMMGNSEVGHMTIGAGRIIKQPIVVIDEMIRSGDFFKNPLLLQRITNLKTSGGTLHLIGLISDAGVHSSLEHLKAYIKLACDVGVKRIVIHAILDGRDTPPRSGERYLRDLENYFEDLKSECDATTIVIGSLHGRFFAMDRDKNWDRTKKSVDVMIHPSDMRHSWQDVLNTSYAQGINDEFVRPIALVQDAGVKRGDGIIFFNIREDRMRQLATRLLEAIAVSWCITAVDYGAGLSCDVLYHQPKIEHTLFDALEKAGKTIFTIAETEKYAHVTYFFNGGREKKRPCETRVLVPSHKHETYVNDPCMSAPEITKTVIESLEKSPCDFYLINYANADMVGHSGDYQATIKAIECLDAQLKKLYDELVIKRGGTMFITADHGNAEEMWDVVHNQPNTHHTTNPVPFYWISPESFDASGALELQGLKDIVPFVLSLMGVHEGSTAGKPN